MDTGNHDVRALFEQLGLPSTDDAIDDFVARHPLPSGKEIYEADFWTTGQASFLEEAIEDDAVWAEPVDELTARLQRVR